MKLGEKGFFYVELVVALAITALVGSAVTAAIFQVFKGTEKSNNHMTAVRQVQNAGYWIGHDTRMAQSLTAENLTPPYFLVLNWTEVATSDEYQVFYTLENMSGSQLKKLHRNQSINGGGSTTTLVAQHIDPNLEKTKCEFTNGKLTLTITATVGEGAPRESECRTYKLVPRPG
ncbi:type II secretion system protein J [Chloroflexota bacterium]